MTPVGTKNVRSVRILFSEKLKLDFRSFDKNFNAAGIDPKNCRKQA
jgi:hypothetical protein